MSDGRPGAYPNFRQQLLRFVLRQPASDHRFRRSSEQCFFLLQRHVCPPNFYDGRFPYPRVALDNEREALGPIAPIAGEQPHAFGTTPRQEPKAVVLDLVNSLRRRSPDRHGRGVDYPIALIERLSAFFIMLIGFEWVRPRLT